MLLALNRILNRMMPLITPLSILTGVLCGTMLSSYTYLSPWLFAFMTFAGSISLGFKDFLNVLKKPLPLFACLFILHIAMPLVALGFGNALYHADEFTITGLVLAAVIPTGVSSFIWVSIYKGNTALTLSIILIDTLLSPFIVPGVLSLLIGTSVELDTLAMMSSLFWMIVVPSLLGMVLNEWTKGAVAPVWSPRLNPFSKLFMAAVIMINGSVISPYLADINLRLVGLAAVIVLMASTGYALCFLTARILRWNEADEVALIFNGGMRNISAGAVLAVSYFPAPVAVPVVLGMVFQQLLASLAGFLLGRRSRIRHTAEHTSAA
ncbi:bile acid:sodium symporter family protein [Paenibacillus sp. S150]|uniref:bile acid:sodium symporter family protein n=1 Tax=Paenibacillus sp. S150 TaxID=2749826 RepID=UPI001C55C7C2|nr:bile acid:sodium symporter family protein [Paenibacillus sp. S150]MBW4084322.1 bile acid:sodium symporter family protein [Paenibacillus sp. S150]